MKFLSIYTAHPSDLKPPSPEGMDAMNKLVAETIASGEMLSTGWFPVPGVNFRVGIAQGEFSLADAPADSNRVRCGYAVLEAKSKEDAVRLTQRFLRVVGYGECELVELHVSVAGGSVFGKADAAPSECAGQAVA